MTKWETLAERKKRVTYFVLYKVYTEKPVKKLKCLKVTTFNQA